MLNKKTIFLALIATLAFTSCSKENDVTQLDQENLQKSFEKNAATTSTTLQSFAAKTKEKPKEKYAKSLEKFKQKMKLSLISSDNGRLAEPLEEIIGDENLVSYTTGEYVGDPNDYVTAADGPVIQAVSQQEEDETRVMLLDQINEAKTYLNSHGIDLSDEYNYDDSRYIHAANIIMEMEDTKGIPGSGGGTIPVARENTTFGCAMQAIGISALYHTWFDKFATKRMLIAAVGKLATRYLGWVGAAVAVYDFIDCMWG
jgi:hypothetical protein